MKHSTKSSTARSIFLTFGSVAVAFLALTFGSMARATPITFTYDPGTSSAVIGDITNFCTGCSISVVKNPTPVNFTLENVGDAFLLSDFLTVSFNAIQGNTYVTGGSATLVASMGFSAPSSATSTDASGGGTFLSGRVQGSIRYQNGAIVWTTQPMNLVFGNGTEISLVFGGANIACGPSNTCTGSQALRIGATTTLMSRETALVTAQLPAQNVPEPGTLALLGIGLAGVGAIRLPRRPARSIEAI